MQKQIKINGRKIGRGTPVYVVAEMSANHNKSFEQAVKIIEAAKRAGADAVKLQTYTPDTITINCDNKFFRITDTIWKGKNLYDLYEEAYTPWEWQPRLKKIADDLNIHLFSAPFDHSAVDFLEKMHVPAYKIASFENIDIPLIEKVAKTGKPVIISTGMASLGEIEDAVETIRKTGNDQIALLKCTSAYPASAEEMNLKTISHLSDTFNVPVGLSDHTLGIEVPITSIALGACIVEKHFTLSRSIRGPDSTFSLEPEEFRQMVNSIRIAEKSLGNIRFGFSEDESKSIIFRRSLFVVADIKAGEKFTSENVRSIRPGQGLSPKYLKEILGAVASRNISKGTPLYWNLIKLGE